jgi:hypothetical protein
MNIDMGEVEKLIGEFWDEYGVAVLAGAGVLVIVLAVIAVVIVVRSRQRDRLVAGVTALVVLAWTSEGLWEVARYTLGLPLGFAVMTFFVYEAMMITCALQAERHRKSHPSPGPAGRYVWVLASITATVVALNAASLVEALLRFTLPLAAAGLWWVGITANRADDSAEVQQLREGERARREAIWAISWRRLLVASGIMRPGVQTLSDAERQRRIRQMVSAANRLRRARPGTRRADRAQRRLENLTEQASANDITTVQAKVARTARIAELVITAADQTITGGHASAPHRGIGHGPLAGTPAPNGNGGASSATRSDVLEGTAPFYPDPAQPASHNGAAASVKHPQQRALGNGGREAARRVYEECARDGRPLSSRELARIAGCSPATAWRAIKAVKQTSGGAMSNGTRQRTTPAGDQTPP